MSAHRDAHSEPTPPWDGHTQDNTQLISKNCLDICQIWGTDGTMPLSERSDHGQMTDTDHTDSAVREGVVAKNRHWLKIPKYTTPFDNNGRKGVFVAPRTIMYRTKSIQTPNTFRLRDTIMGKSEEPNGHTSRSSDSGTGVVINKGPTVYHEWPLYVNPTILQSEGNREAHPSQQLADRNAPGSEAKPDTEHTNDQGHTTTELYPVLNQEEPFTNRDARLIPTQVRNSHEVSIIKIRTWEAIAGTQRFLFNMINNTGQHQTQFHD